jgi:hypothetical protein
MGRRLRYRFKPYFELQLYTLCSCILAQQAAELRAKSLVECAACDAGFAQSHLKPKPEKFVYNEYEKPGVPTVVQTLHVG